MARMNHENIVKFFGLEQVEGLDYSEKVLVMELCAEGNACDFIYSQPNGLTSFELLRFFQNMMNAMKHLRDNDLVHRDIKPSNIVRANRGDGNTIYKLADFGAARILKKNQNYGSLYGTCEYIHTDIFAKLYSSALDIVPTQRLFNEIHELWSLGVTLYEAATGKLPFEPINGRDDLKTMYKMISQKQSGCVSARH